MTNYFKNNVSFVLRSWGLSEDKLHCVISDTASNMKKGLSAWTWIGCFLHILNLIVKNSIFTQSGVQRLIKKIKNLIKEFRTPTGESQHIYINYILIIQNVH